MIKYLTYSNNTALHSLCFRTGKSVKKYIAHSASSSPYPEVIFWVASSNEATLFLGDEYAKDDTGENMCCMVWTCAIVICIFRWKRQ